MSLLKENIALKCFSGSRLFGTAKPGSDQDFLGVFFPTMAELFMLKGYEDEKNVGAKASDEKRKNTRSDVDEKYFSLQKFLVMALAGKVHATEFLFIPSKCIHVEHPLWQMVIDNKDAFLSYRSVAGFLGYADGQLKCF